MPVFCLTRLPKEPKEPKEPREPNPQRHSVDDVFFLPLMFPLFYNFTRRKRSAFVMTDTELNVMAALAKIGFKSRPRKG